MAWMGPNPVFHLTKSNVVMAWTGPNIVFHLTKSNVVMAWTGPNTVFHLTKSNVVMAWTGPNTVFHLTKSNVHGAPGAAAAAAGGAQGDQGGIGGSSSSSMLNLKFAEFEKKHMELHEDHTKLKALTKDLWTDHTELKALTIYLSAKELVLCAGEIWKWAVNKKGTVVGDGGHLSDPQVFPLVLVAAKAMDMLLDINGLKQLSRECIVARNKGAHFSTLKVLEDSVLFCKKAIKMYPTLDETYPAQVKTVSKYFELKRYLPQCFSDN